MTAISTRSASFVESAQDARDGHRFVRALEGRIEPVPVGLTYRIGLLFAAVTMLVLPLVYVALVGAAAYGVYWHAVNNITIFESRGSSKGKILVYLGPLLIGIILVLFMIKPLFARRPRRSKPTGLERDKEPVLFLFVERLCEVVGAPKPSRIQVDTQVNASASFREGLVGFAGKELVLTIGLPLAAGLTIRQLTGVLAHEFGHFAQGTGMRLTFIVRSINAWFARVVYERDAWDESLERAARDGGHIAITILLQLSRLFVWLTRRVLWVLMIIGHGVSSFMLRQMEFDADRYETRVAGSDEFSRTSTRIRMLSVASNAAFSDLNAAWQERRLGDDIALLICHRDATMPGEVRLAISKHAAADKTGWFDTHPCDSARIRSSEREAAPGLFRLEDPATDLFADFCTLSRDTTVAFYQCELGLPITPENLISSSDLISSRDKQEEAQKSAFRFFQGLVHPASPVFFKAPIPLVRDADKAAGVLLARRGEVTQAAQHLTPVSKAFTSSDKKMLMASGARALLSAGVKINFASFELPKTDDQGLRVVEQAAGSERDAAIARVNEVVAAQMERLQVALALGRAAAALPSPSSPPPVPGTSASADPDEVELVEIGEYELEAVPAAGSEDALLAAFAALGRGATQIEEVRRHFVSLAMLLKQLQPNGGSNSETLIGEILSRTRKVSRVLADARKAMGATAYPYEHVERGVSVAAFVVPVIPGEEDVTAAYQAADNAPDTFYSLYMRILSDLCSRAEAVERSIGLEPLPEPGEAKESAEPAA